MQRYNNVKCKAIEYDIVHVKEFARRNEFKTEQCRTETIKKQIYNVNEMINKAENP